MDAYKQILERWGLSGCVVVGAVAAILAGKFDALPLWGWGALLGAAVMIGLVGARNEVAEAVGGLHSAMSTSLDELGETAEKTAKDVGDIRSIVHRNLSAELLCWLLPRFGDGLKWELARAVLTVRSGEHAQDHVADVFLPVLHAQAMDLCLRTRSLDEATIRLAYESALYTILPDVSAFVAQPGCGGSNLHRSVDVAVDRATNDLIASLGGGS